MFSVEEKNNLLTRLNKLRGIRKGQKKLHVREKKEFESSLIDVKLILLQHKLFLRLEPLSPIFDSETSIFSPIISNSSNPISTLENRSETFEILSKFKNFSNLRPISPIPSSPELENSVVVPSAANTSQSRAISRDPRITTETLTYKKI